MRLTTIATADTHEKLLLAATLVPGYPAPLSAVTNTDATSIDSGSITRVEDHLAVSL